MLGEQSVTCSRLAWQRSNGLAGCWALHQPDRSGCAPFACPRAEAARKLIATFGFITAKEAEASGV